MQRAGYKARHGDERFECSPSGQSVRKKSLSHERFSTVKSKALGSMELQNSGVPGKELN